MIDQQTKNEIDLIAEAADRLARRMGATFVKDPAKVQDFPGSGSEDNSEYQQDENSSDSDEKIVMA